MIIKLIGFPAFKNLQLFIYFFIVDKPEITTVTATTRNDVINIDCVFMSFVFTRKFIVFADM